MGKYTYIETKPRAKLANIVEGFTWAMGASLSTEGVVSNEKAISVVSLPRCDAVKT